MTTANDDSAVSECEFQIGDHVYQWCSFVGIPAVFQHHGIVMNCYYRLKESYDDDDDDDENHKSDDENDTCESEQNNAKKSESRNDDDGEWMIQIADFTNVDHDPRLQNTTLPDGTIDPSFSASLSSTSRKRSFGISPKNSSNGGGYQIRTYTVSLSSKHDKWYRVIYSANWWQRQIHRTGTCTSASSDPPGLVRARVQFLLDHPDILPSYDAITANCECVAVWCKTGTWATLQAINWLVMTAAGQVKSAVTVGSIAAATQVTTTVPAAGFWGWMGYTSTTTVPLLATQPYLLPAIIGYGVVTVAAPTLWLLHAKKHAKRTTETLNKSFWEQAIDRPELFVECITHWSALYEPNQETYHVLNELTSTMNSEDSSTDLSPEVKTLSEEHKVNETSEAETVAHVTYVQSTGQHSVEDAK